jgi:adenosylhomocysteine nucleosidase
MSQDNVADVVIVTALKSEYDAVLRYLDSPQKVSSNNRIIHKAYLQHEDSETRYEVVVLCFGGMGNVQSATAVTQVINDWKPTAIILTGIMAGFEASERFLGDLIIPEEIVGYELGKVTSAGIERRLKGLQTTYEMIHKSRHFPDNKWVLDNRIIPRPDQQSRRVNPKVHFGVVASGEKVMADK